MLNPYFRRPVRQRAFFRLLLFLLSAGPPALAQPVLVKDIYSPLSGCCYNANSSSPEALTHLNGTLLFTATTGDGGRELWRSNGSAAGTVPVKDIWPGANSSNPTGFTLFNNALYFAANGGGGVELWRSDGTTTGTVLVKDLNPGGSSGPASLTNVNGTLFFTADDGSGEALWRSNGTAAGTVKVKAGSARNLTNVNGTLFFTRTFADSWELWKSNGTATGTVLVSKVYPSPEYEYPQGFDPAELTAFNGALYFSAVGEGGRELWKSNGTAAGTGMVKDIRPGYYSFYSREDGEITYHLLYNDSTPWGLITLNGALYFTAYSETGTGVWKSDGTEAGTVLLKDLAPDFHGSTSQRLVAVNNAFYFTANDNADQYGLWKSDGTPAGTALVTPLAYPISNLTAVNGMLYFTMENGSSPTGTGASTSAWELWKSNGTAAGTGRIKALYPVGFGPMSFQLTNVNGTVFFVNDDLVNGQELWKSNGTEAGTGMVQDIFPGLLSRDANPADLTNVNGTLFFTAVDATNGQGLWKSNGTAAGTVKLPVNNSVNSYSQSPPIQNLVNLNGVLYFTTMDAGNYYRLWKSNGTPAGTLVVRDFGSGDVRAGHPPLLVVNGVLYLFVRKSGAGSQLWKSDGTATGTVLVRDFYQDVSSEYPQHLTSLNGTLYFVMLSGDKDWFLWKSNGTAAGTVEVKKIGRVNTEAYYPAWNVYEGPFLAVNGTLYFPGSDDAGGRELWKSNGTAASTVRVKDIFPGGGSSDPASFAALNGSLYFSAAESAAGAELWKSDGTAAGTVRVKDIYPGAESSFPQHLTAHNGALYFGANDGSGFELWKSNGTAAGTVRVKDIAPGPASASPAELKSIGNLLYFRADDGAAGAEFWRSDGTTAGTQLVQDLYAGAASSGPAWFTGVNGTVFLAATTAAFGRELWKYNPADCVTPNPNLTVVPATACPGSAATVQLKASQAGVQYQLYSGSSPVGASFAGTGGDLYLGVPAASLSAGTTTFALRAKGCVETELAAKATVTLVGSLPAPTAPGVTVSSGQAATLTAVGGPPDATYLWYNVASGGSVLKTSNPFVTPALTATTDYYVATQVAGCTPSARTKVIVTVAGAAPGIFRVNAGGSGFPTIDARAFAADAYFSGGVVSMTTPLGIASTADDYLYQTGRHGASFAYHFPTGNGAFNVVLHFSETYWGNNGPGGAGSRRFHVDMEGARKLTNYDIFAKAGGALRATQETFRVHVSDGTLNVNFLKGLADNPAVKAIEVLPAGSALAVNAGGSAFTTAAGKRFSADVYFADGTVSTPATADIAGTTDDALYRTGRFGPSFSYGLPSGNGTFDVILHFSENYWGSRASGGVGSRRFNVYVEGVKRLSEYDIFARAGGASRAVKETLRVTVSDGVLNLYFAKGAADNAFVSAVEVVAVTNVARVAAGEPSPEAGPVRLYPNPVQDRLTVSLPFPAGQVRATAITDATGRVHLPDAHKAVGENELEIRTAGLPAGLYLLRLETDHGSRVVKFARQ